MSFAGSTEFVRRRPLPALLDTALQRSRLRLAERRGESGDGGAGGSQRQAEGTSHGVPQLRNGFGVLGGWYSLFQIASARSREQTHGTSEQRPLPGAPIWPSMRASTWRFT